jgi:hypothetical protein
MIVWIFQLMTYLSWIELFLFEFYYNSGISILDLKILFRGISTDGFEIYSKEGYSELLHSSLTIMSN